MNDKYVAIRPDRERFRDDYYVSTKRGEPPSHRDRRKMRNQLDEYIGVIDDAFWDVFDDDPDESTDNDESR